MSMFRLKNNTGSDSLQDWCDYTFPNGTSIDLIDTPEIHSAVEDIIGIHNGIHFESIRDLLKTGQWNLNDGDTDLSLEDSLYLIKYGKSIIIKNNPYLGNSAVAFESHNLADIGEWVDGESKFVITPDTGKELLLKGSKILIDKNLITDDSMYFRVYAGSYLIAETVYENSTQLLLGAINVFHNPQIGNILTTGAPELLHIMYKYEEPIPLKSSLGMRLEIGFTNNNEPKSSGSILKLRINATSVKE